MIHIDNARLDIPNSWKEEALLLTNLLRTLPEDQRAAFINGNSRIWGRLKSKLEELSYFKCWYCETKNTRSDFHVDHHRPKNRVKNEDGDEVSNGYWWLAFDIANFRLACSYCNSLHTGSDGIVRGKSDKFPLLFEANRASSPESNLNDEIPLLLDPTNPADRLVLWFMDDGTASPRYSEAEGILHRRARVTIEILNLNDVKIVEERRKLWSACTRLIERGNRAFCQYKNGSPTGKMEFEIIIQEILELVQPQAEFSATARSCLRGSSYQWARELAQ
ncbi:MAG: hypothetical protein NWE92_01660 [Candidatus Bathyarchaeota archaeon]|nr:hypothetical protein [Candidatus Bathyarchaeota archaeon]